MKTHIMPWFSMLLFGIMMFGCGSGASGEIMVSTGVRVNAVQDDHTDGLEGHEFTIPVSVVYSGNRFSISLLAGYSSAFVTQPDEEDAELESVTDTLLSATYLSPQLPFNLFCLAGVNLNLPTGTERLTLLEERATVGEQNDLMEVESFGEGLNVGLSLSLIRPFGNVTAGISGTYVYVGAYDPTKEIQDDDLDPGDQVLIAGTVQWEISPRFTLNPLVIYTYFFPDTVDGEDDFQQGSALTIENTFQYTRAPFDITTGMQMTLPQKNQELEQDALHTEPENSNSLSLSTMLNIMYVRSEALTLRAVGDLRYYAESDRQDTGTGLPYSGERIRYSVGPGIQYALNKHVELQILVRYLVMHEAKSLTLDQDTTYQGIAANAEIVCTF